MIQSYNSSQADLKDVFSKINGVLFPGGSNSLDNTTLYQAGQYLYNLALNVSCKLLNCHLLLSHQIPFVSTFSSLNQISAPSH